MLDLSVDVSAGLQAVLIFEFYLRGNFPALMTKDNRHKKFGLDPWVRSNYKPAKLLDDPAFELEN